MCSEKCSQRSPHVDLECHLFWYCDDDDDGGGDDHDHDGGGDYDNLGQGMSVLSACKNEGKGLRFDLSPTLCVMALKFLFSNIAWLDDHELALFSKID